MNPPTAMNPQAGIASSIGSVGDCEPSDRSTVGAGVAIAAHGGEKLKSNYDVCDGHEAAGYRAELHLAENIVNPETGPAGWKTSGRSRRDCASVVTSG